MAPPDVDVGPPSPDIPKINLGGSGSKPRASTPTPGGNKPMPKLSSANRAASAGKEKAPPSPLTPRQKKATRSLFRELGQTARTIAHMITRVKRTHMIVDGTIKELQAASEGARQSLKNNYSMVLSTKDTGDKPGKEKGASTGMTPRPLNETEMEELSRELRNKLVAGGEERFPTEYEIDAERQARIEAKKMEAQSSKRRSSKANKPIVEALEKLAESSGRLALELTTHEEQLRKQMDLLDEIWHSLVDHEQVRDQIFDPVLSNPKIKRSVLYQKTNPMEPIKLDLDDKDQKSTKGRNKFGATGHEATEIAAEREDGARAACTKAIHAVRAASSELALRKSSLQVSVRTSRELVMKSWRAAKTGKFGSSEERNTDPSTRKTATNPEDAGE